MIFLWTTLALTAGLGRAAIAKDTNTLVYVTYWDVDSMDPAWSDNMSPLLNVYETLVDYDGASASRLVPRLATELPSRENGLISPDGLTYRFPIRKGVLFHDGSTLTPEDVRYSLLRFMLMDRAGGPPGAALLGPLTGLSSTRKDGKALDEAYEKASAALRVDGDAVVLRLRRPFAPILAVLANFGRVVSKDWCAANGQWDGRAETWKRHNGASREDSLPNGKGNGTGPFKIERWDPVARQLLLARHDGYWRGPAGLERVAIKAAPEIGARKLMLQAGDADVIGALPIHLALLEGLPGVELTKGLRKLQSATNLSFNFKIEASANPLVGSGRLDGGGIPPDFFADRDAREGFAAAIDYDAFVRDVLKGQGERSGAIFPDSPARPRREFDLREAERHLRRAWGGKAWDKGFKLALVHLAGRDDLDITARMIKRNIESLNPRFRVETRAVPLAAYADLRASRKLALSFSNWTADYADPHDFAFALLHSQGALARTYGYAYPKADELIERGARELDPVKRAAIYRELESLADEELPFAPIAANTHLRVQRSWVKGYVFNPAMHGGPYDSEYYRLRKE